MLRVLAWLTPVAIVGALAGARWGGEFVAWALPDADGHGAWYASRASGIAAYLCLWVGLVGGLLMSSAWFDGIVNRARLLVIHQTASVAGILLGFGHALILIPDTWTQFGPIDVLVPFGSYYERVDLAIGSLSLYLMTIVAASFWVRRSLGMRLWRLLHYSSFVAFAGALWHGIRVGTDSNESWLMGLYFVTSLAVVFALVLRLTYVRETRRKARPGTSIA